MKLYVGNLSYRTTEDEIREVFEKHGTVDSVSVIIDRASGRSKGFAFVEMSDRDEANTAISELDGTPLGDRNIAVNEARPQQPRTGGGGGGGGGGGKRFGGGGGGGGGGGSYGRRY